ncbi:MAG: response regulator [Fuerstiella sp.]
MNRSFEVLLVEDNDDDVVLTKRAFQQTKYDIVVTHVENGVECLKLLEERCNTKERRLPDLMLLDLNMPLMSGSEVMEVISGDARLNTMPVVALSTSTSEKEIREMYRLQCRLYLSKSVDLLQFRKDITALGHYWFDLVTLPPPHTQIAS